MRCFIAIDIDKSVREELAELQQELAGAVDIRKGDVKWVRPDATHLTLKFLGEIKDKDAVDVCNAAKLVASRHEGFEIEVATVGHFGGRSARVLWVGAGLDCEPLAALHDDLEGELETIGFAREGRKFSGHLTLCRIRNAKAGFKLAKLTEQYRDYDLGSIRAGAICVYQSQLTPNGPVYTLLGKYPMGPVQ
jgi:2'-5' RNA ligase